MTDNTTLRCSCCNLPFAYVQRGVLMVMSRHNGERHTNVITLQDIQELIEQQDITIQTTNDVLH